MRDDGIQVSGNYKTHSPNEWKKEKEIVTDFVSNAVAFATHALPGLLSGDNSGLNIDAFSGSSSAFPQ